MFAANLCFKFRLLFNYAAFLITIIYMSSSCISIVRASGTSDDTAAAIMNIQIVSYEEIKDLPNHPEKLLIDVREPQELIDSGIIPTSINIPLANVSSVLDFSSDPVAFKTKYGREKPKLDSYIIFSCRSGKRSQIAAEAAVKLGYTNVHNYSGSWLDWAKHEFGSN